MRRYRSPKKRRNRSAIVAFARDVALQIASPASSLDRTNGGGLASRPSTAASGEPEGGEFALIHGRRRLRAYRFPRPPAHNLPTNFLRRFNASCRLSTPNAPLFRLL